MYIYSVLEAKKRISSLILQWLTENSHFRPKIAILDQQYGPKLKFSELKIEFSVKNMYLERFGNKHTSLTIFLQLLSFFGQK